jgi:hypothetical protein
MRSALLGKLAPGHLTVPLHAGNRSQHQDLWLLKILILNNFDLDSRRRGESDDADIPAFSADHSAVSKRTYNAARRFRYRFC